MPAQEVRLPPSSRLAEPCGAPLAGCARPACVCKLGAGASAHFSPAALPALADPLFLNIFLPLPPLSPLLFHSQLFPSLPSDFATPAGLSP